MKLKIYISGTKVNFIKEIRDDYRFVICISVEGFLREVKEYLKG